MTDWIPEISVADPERTLILDLIRLCKKELVYHRSVITALQTLANSGNSAVALQFADGIQGAQDTVRPDVDVLFRRSESALMRGEEYRHILQALVSKLI